MGEARLPIRVSVALIDSGRILLSNHIEDEELRASLE